MKRIILFFNVFLILVLSAIKVIAGPPPAEHRILEQPNSPVKIITYNAEYQKGTRYQQEGIRHTVSCHNISDRKIVALQFGFKEGMTYEEVKALKDVVIEKDHV